MTEFSEWDMGHTDRVAWRKSDSIVGWEAYFWKRIGEDGLLIRGGVPRIKTRGKNKGNKTWDSNSSTESVVTHSEIEAEKQRFISETGKCPECLGKGEVFASWNHETGTKYKPCKKCNSEPC